MPKKAAREDWTCPKCGRSFLARNARHACNAQSPETLLAPFPQMRPAYEAVRDLLLSWPGVEVEATRTQVSFRARRRFAYLWVPALSLRGGAEELMLTFDLARPAASPRFTQVVEPRPGMWTHHLKLPTPDAVDEDVRAWLREAYETRGGTPPERRR